MMKSDIRELLESESWLWFFTDIITSYTFGPKKKKKLLKKDKQVHMSWLQMKNLKKVGYPTIV